MLFRSGHASVDVPRGIADAVGAEGSDTLTIGFRPETLIPTSDTSARGIPVTVDLLEELGSDAYIYGHLSGSENAPADRLRSETVIARVEPRNAPQKGDSVVLQVRQGGEHYFSVKTGERIAG